MRKRYRVLMLAVIVAALAVPFTFALSLESAAPAVVVVQSPVTSPSPGSPGSHPFPERVKLFLVGSALCGLAAAARRAV